jgi:predicted DNA-binding WGR domain protein
MDINFKFIGWCKEDNHDKVWAAIMLSCSHGKPNPWSDVKYVAVWGKRGKKLQHKVIQSQYRDLDKLVHEKERKGYNRVSKHKLEQVYPEFENDLQSTAVWAMLTV